MIRVTVWNEGLHEKASPEISNIYPEGIHGLLSKVLSTQEDFEVRTATLSQRKCGLPDEVLESTDVLIWWGHMAHGMVPDKLARKIQDRVLRGMGFIALHSAHFSKPFKLLMGTSCSLHWRDGDFERLWVINPAHPIAKGVDPYICTVRGLISPNPMSWFLRVGSPAATCSVRAAAGAEDLARFSISSPDMRLTPHTTSLRFSR